MARVPNSTQFRIVERSIKQSALPIDSSLLVDWGMFEQAPIQIFGNSRTVYSSKECEGLFIIRGAIPKEIQMELVKLILESWSRPPNVSNLDSHFLLNPMGIWNQYVECQTLKREDAIKRRFFDKVGSLQDNGILIDSPVSHMLEKADLPISLVLPRLRWLTLGYQYDWSCKEYHMDRVALFPAYLDSITKEIIRLAAPFVGYESHEWRAEAGIVNFYQVGDSLTAHQDKSELNTKAPLLSISIGLECVFLIGTENRNDQPMAIKLESGDLVIMSGKARRSFHGVPRVLKDTLPSYLTNHGSFSEYLSRTRINLNIRQVN